MRAAARRVFVAALLACVLVPPAAAGIPAAYGAVVITPPALVPRAEFDLTDAVARAAREGKRLYLYLGARDCPYCRQYEAFLEQHAKELVPHFGPYLIVDLRGALSVTAENLVLKVGDTRRNYTEFQQAIGDERARRLVYPTVWLLDATLKPLMQMPAGAGTFITVPEQLEVLRLEQ